MIERRRPVPVMSFHSSITIIASPRPRVGKTLLARLLADLDRQEGDAVATFDLNAGEKTLLHFLPEQTTTATIRDIAGQMALFDRLVADKKMTKRVIDLGPRILRMRFTVTHQIGFVEEARSRSIAVAILFTITPRQDSRREQSAASARPGSHTVGSTGSRSNAPDRGTAISIRLRAEVNRPFPFALARGLRRIGICPLWFVGSQLGRRGRLPSAHCRENQRWLRRIYLEFRELDLRILLADLRSSIRFGS